MRRNNKNEILLEILQISFKIFGKFLASIQFHEVFKTTVKLLIGAVCVYLANSYDSNTSDCLWGVLCCKMSAVRLLLVLMIIEMFRLPTFLVHVWTMFRPFFFTDVAMYELVQLPAKTLFWLCSSVTYSTRCPKTDLISYLEWIRYLGDRGYMNIYSNAKLQRGSMNFAAGFSGCDRQNEYGI